MVRERWSIRAEAFLVVVLAAFAPEDGGFRDFPVCPDDGEEFAFDDLLAGDDVAAIAATEFHLRLHT